MMWWVCALDVCTQHDCRMDANVRPHLSPRVCSAKERCSAGALKLCKSALKNPGVAAWQQSFWNSISMFSAELDGFSRIRLSAEQAARVSFISSVTGTFFTELQVRRQQLCSHRWSKLKSTMNYWKRPLSNRHVWVNVICPLLCLCRF